MKPEDIRQAYLDELTKIAPDIDAVAVGENDHIQDDLELDSMDVLNLVTALHERFGVDIAETDYPHIATVALAVAFFQSRVA